MTSKELADRYREWAICYSIVNYGDDKEHIRSFIDSLWDYAEFLDNIPKFVYHKETDSFTLE